MKDRELLPPVLREQSLSDREIVLPPENASRAIDYLEAAQWAVIGWEPWLKLANGSHLHPIAGGSFEQEEQEVWTAYVHRTAQLCRQVMIHQRLIKLEQCGVQEVIISRRSIDSFKTLALLAQCMG